jgi:hypothetical protein
MKLAFIFDEKKISGKLTKLFTGCYAYHCGWVDAENGVFYDMNLIGRRRSWPAYKSSQIVMFEVPEVSKEYLEYDLTNNNARYGVIDYALFLIRPILHWFGKPTINAGGIICSEKCNNDMVNCGVRTPWGLHHSPPSPCALLDWMLENYDPVS